MKKRFAVVLHLIPVIISLLLVGAHFLRSGNLFFTAFSFLLIMALCIREPLVARVVQVALFLATVEWIHVAFTLVSSRLDAGLPWGKLSIILGAVAALSLASIGLFLSSALKEMYHLSHEPRNHSHNGRGAHPTAILSKTVPAPTTEHRQKLLSVHYLKNTLTTCSLLAFLIMDYSSLLGMVTLIAVALTNSSLRAKMKQIGGVLSLEDRKKLYVRQTFGLCLLSLPIIGYYSFSLPALKLTLIVGSVIAVFTMLLWAAARYEYIGNGANL